MRRAAVLLAASAALVGAACQGPAGERARRLDERLAARGGALAAGERAPASEAEPAAQRSPVGDAIVVCGERIGIGTPVVLWTEPGGYDGYSLEPAFPSELTAPAPEGPRYRPGRAGGTAAPAVLAAVDQLVLHYDACGTSRRCFRVLQDQRGLSVHFLLDVDGTLYQTLDLAETAWHARQSNGRSIGVEIANPGAYPPGEATPFDDWYFEDEAGLYLRLPGPEAAHVRTPGFTGRPARPQRVRGVVQGRLLEQVDYTPEQYAALEALAAALCRHFPRLEPVLPRNAIGRVPSVALEAGELERFAGILGHHHITVEKTDPGPAFEWERFLRGVRARVERGAP